MTDHLSLIRQSVQRETAVPRHWAFPVLPPTGNKALRMHWAERRRHRQTWAKAVLAMGRPPDLPPRRAAVTIAMWRVKLQDPDNRRASVKPVLDALVTRGWLADDNDDHLVLEVLEFKAERHETGTRIEWRPM